MLASGGGEWRYPRLSLEEALAFDCSISVGEEKMGGVASVGSYADTVSFVISFCFSLCYRTLLAFICGDSSATFTDVFFRCGWLPRFREAHKFLGKSVSGGGSWIGVVCHLRRVFAAVKYRTR